MSEDGLLSALLIELLRKGEKLKTNFSKAKLEKIRK